MQEDIANEDDEVDAFYFTRVSNNDFNGGEVGRVSAPYILMIIPENEVIISATPVSTKEVDQDYLESRKEKEKN